MALPFDSPGFRDALLIIGSAGLVIPAFHRLRVNPVIGFILVGIAVGPHGLGSLTDGWPWLKWITIADPAGIEALSEIGVILLLFVIGLDLSFDRLRSMRRTVFRLGTAEVALCAGAIAWVLMMLGEPVQAAVVLGLALALSSTALVVPIVGVTGAVGRLAFAMLIFEDLALVPILFVLTAVGGMGDEGTPGGLIRTLLLGASVIAVLLFAGRKLLPLLFRQAARTRSPELFLAASLLSVIGASILTTAVGLSPVMGALVAGMVIAETEYGRQVEVTVEPFKGLALGVFLISVGMTIDIAAIVRQPLAIAAALAGVVILKALVVTALLRIGRAPHGIARHLGILMAAPSETTLIVLSAAVSAGVVSTTTAGFWQLVTALGLTLTPLLARWGRIAERRAAAAALSTDAVATAGETPPARVVIAGYGRVGQLVADMLDRHRIDYVAVDTNIDTVVIARAEGKPVLYGDTSRIDIVERLNLNNALALVVTMNQPVGALEIVRAARARHPGLVIVARAQDATHAAQLYHAGATDAVPETVEASLQLAEAVLVDVGRPMGPVIASIHEKRAELRQQIIDQAPKTTRFAAKDARRKPGGTR